MQSAPQGPIILTFEDARHLVERYAATLCPRGKELTQLLGGIGLILAEPVSADRDFPPFPRAARDGYAVRATDVESIPAELTVIGEIRAGGPEDSEIRVESGQAVSIMTGAASPPGADAIVMVEHTSRKDNQVEINKKISAGENIVPAGSEAKQSDRLLAPGMRLDHAALAVAASVGRTHLLVYSKPRIAILATGDEIVDISALPRRNQIRNSNTYSLAAQIQAAGGEPILLPIAPDEPARLRELIVDGLEADLLLISGGVSMGKYDLVEQALAEFNAEFFFTAVQVQPGRPTVFGQVPCGTGALPRDELSAPSKHKYFFGLPGNPVSTMVTFELFARPMVEALAGITPRKLVFFHAKLKSEIKTKTGLKRFLPAILSGEFDQAEVELAGWQGSGDIAATARANCYIVIPPDREKILAGEWVPVMMR
jgi:molybdopterin molybdotransferase